MNGGWWFEMGILVAAVVGTACVILAAVYDIRHVWLARRRKLHLRRPPVTVIVVVHKMAANLETQVQSIRRLRYRHYDIVIAVDARAGKDTKRQARACHPSDRVYIARKQTSFVRLIRNAYRRSQQGEYVLVLDQTQSIASDSLNHMTTLLSENEEAMGLTMARTLPHGMSVRAAIESMGQLSQKLVTKAISITGLYRSRTIRPGRIYRREVILNTHRHRLTYDSKTEMAGKTSSWLVTKIVGFVAGIGFVGVVIYSSVLAARLETAEPLLLSWSAVVLWIFVTIWLDDTTRLWQKVGLIVCLPLSYFAIVGAIVVRGTQMLFSRQQYGFYVRFFAYVRSRLQV